MKAISLKQPWANLILEGLKTIETRKWQTQYRGDLLICTSLKPDYEYPSGILFYKLNLLKNRSMNPLGVALCVVELYDTRDMTTDDEPEAACFLYDKAKAWMIRNVRPVQTVHIKGTLSLFEVNDSLIKYL